MVEEVWTKRERLAPFSKDTGSLASYYIPHLHHLKDASQPFSASLTITNFDKGWRSAHRVIWTASDGKEYPMFISEFLALVKKYYERPLTTFPTVHGRWVYVKRGSNYGISFLEEA